MENTNSWVKLPSRPIILVLLVMMLAVSGTAGALISGVFFKPASAAPVLYDEGAVVALYEKASPAVVEINVVQSVPSRFRAVAPQQGQGSGFLEDTEGHILTNYHVVQGATHVEVLLSDGRTLEAQIAGTSPADDIALLKVDPQAVKGIAPLTLGDSDAAKPGQMAIALGSPFGLENSITVGVVSGVNRSRTGGLGRPITGMLQTDASINPGNSGGPLLNSRGEVIGINTAIETLANGSTGIGFAVSINSAKNLLPRLLQNATVKRPWLGISGIAISSGLADQLGLTTLRGIYIVAIGTSSPAEHAGLIGGGTGTDGTPSAGGDIITAADGRSVGSVQDLASYFGSLKPGDTVNLNIIRNGRPLQLSVALGEWPDSLGG